MTGKDGLPRRPKCLSDASSGWLSPVVRGKPRPKPAALIKCRLVTRPSRWLVILVTACVAAQISPAGAQSADRSSDGISAYKLAKHNAAVRYDKDVTMWDCWDSGVTPSFSAWNGRKWVLWTVGEVSRDQRKCQPGEKNVVYSYHVSLKGKPVRNRAYNLLRVKEACQGCYTSYWTLPVLPPGAAADREAPPAEPLGRLSGLATK